MNKNLYQNELDSLKIIDGPLSNYKEILYVDRIVLEDIGNLGEFNASLVFKSKTLYIDRKYYNNSKKEVEDIIRYVIKNTTESEFCIASKVLITNKILDSFKDTDYISELYLGDSLDNSYMLTYKNYIKLKRTNLSCVYTNAVDNRLMDNFFDDFIGYNKNRKLIKNYTYKDLSNLGIIFLYELDLKELDNLKYVKDATTIMLMGDSYRYVNLIYKYLDNYNKKNEVVIDIGTEKEKFNSYLKENEIDNRVKIEINSFTYKISTISLELYKKVERILYDIIKPALLFSPFEKYIYAYNISKLFKDYKENEDDKTQSRSLYKILFNDYMVCVAFSDLFGDLLTKLGIENEEYSVCVDTSFDEVDPSDQNYVINHEISEEYHSRRLVHIVDLKYKIDGYYISDPTWDNDLNQDLYNYLALTHNEILDNYRYNHFNKADLSEMFFSNTKEELYIKMNFFINRYNLSYPDVKSFMQDFIELLFKIDYKFVSYIYNKYDYIYDLDWDDNYTLMIDEVFSHVESKINNVIPLDTILSAVRFIYLKEYGYNLSNVDDAINNMKKENAYINSFDFPTRYKISKDNKIEEIYPHQNKFK